jgi:hypothetical protein
MTSHDWKLYVDSTSELGQTAQKEKVTRTNLEVNF